MVQVLEKRNVNVFDLRIIKPLYWKQTANVLVDGQETEDIAICREVRPGCVLSPYLFNIYADETFKGTTEDVELGIKINETYINNIRYADDTVLIAESMEDLQELIDKIDHKRQQFRLSINV